MFKNIFTHKFALTQEWPEFQIQTFIAHNPLRGMIHQRKVSSEGVKKLYVKKFRGE